MRGMMAKTGLRAGFTVFGWAMTILAGTAMFFWLAYATEVPWMERMGANGTGTAIATAWMVAPVLLGLIAVMLYRFRDARLPVLLGWAASLPLFAGLYAVAYSYSYCLCENLAP
jgi:hypothetical protein